MAGAGAAGLMAAGRAAQLGADVLLLERTNRPANKLRLSGHGRCNLTNTAQLADFVARYGPNGRFLYRAFSRFFRDDLLGLLERYGVRTRAEADGRVFPSSNQAADVAGALWRYAQDCGVSLRTGARVTGIQISGRRVSGVMVGPEALPAAAVVLATGGASRPETGSTGDGYRLAAEVGHTIVKLRPALVPLMVKEIGRAQSLQGVSLPNVRLTAFQCEAGQIELPAGPPADWGRGLGGRKKPRMVIESRTGELMFTHFGLGGPVTLLLSLAVAEALERGPVSVSIDLFPALAGGALQRRLQAQFDRFGRRSLRHLLDGLLPHKLVDPILEMSGLPPDRLGHQMAAVDRERLAGLFQSIRFNIKGTLPLAAAMVTAGGVCLEEIEPKTMASRRVSGLYFGGEVMDLDADTGGFNLQAAFSTGWVAGEEAARAASARP